MSAWFKLMGILYPLISLLTITLLISLNNKDISSIDGIVQSDGVYTFDIPKLVQKLEEFVESEHISCDSSWSEKEFTPIIIDEQFCGRRIRFYSICDTV